MSAAARLGPGRVRGQQACAYSFMAEPQPAALTTMASTPARSNVSIAARANATASSCRPLCSDSAPQQP